MDQKTSSKAPFKGIHEK
ncbi:carbamoyl-phosphate synthase large subunit [Salipiger bermudensis HTCC2601]|uniref:Carbamoyl-phosphate synthase large subunit n=1 Tax=Salipiger bermudensis (strain DSM 26914 / JCM 13377 / KCTC 12554 / HTCC2601) TaxID=314265 RepID=Q0FVJ5_SALBH|nr:carbamoyl-phosphate synthase large subunit [Salipiger bermudensis HTCC2601]